MPHDQVTSAIDGNILTISLNRPGKLNAVTPAMLAAMNEALIRAESDDNIRVILLLASGRDFCVGLDKTAFESGDVGELKHAGRFIRLLAGATKPLVAGVQGRAVGVGFTMLLHCDCIVVADDGALSAPFVSLGVIPEAGSTVLLRQRVGYTRAFALLSGLRKVSGIEAVEWGLATVAAVADEVAGAAREAARVLAEQPASALQATKVLMRNATAILETIEREGPVFDRHFEALAASPR